MTKTGRFIFAICLATLVFAWHHHVLMTKPPSVIIVGGMSYDFGEIPLNQPAEHDFILRNPHPYKETLTDLETGCACARAYFSRDKIAPRGAERLCVIETPDEPGPVSAGLSFSVRRANQSAAERIILTGEAVKRK